MTDTTTLTRERADLLEALRQHRFLLRLTTRDLTDEQAARRTTVSALCLGGLVKHVTFVERGWADFAAGLEGSMTHGSAEDHENSFRMLPGETLAGLLAEYELVAARTDGLVADLDLDEAHPLPEAPWFPPGATRSNRRVFVHVVAETSQHAGHADIIREALDGAKSMG